MLTKAFNCFECKKPFDRAEGEPTRPVLSEPEMWEASLPDPICSSCLTTYTRPSSQRGLMDFLNQRAFNKTDEGYVYTLPINGPVCFGCHHPIDIFEGELAFVARCGHYLCQACDINRLAGARQYNYTLTVVGNLMCTVCEAISDVYEPYPADARLAAFSSEMKNRRIQELDERFNEKEKQMKALAAEKARLAAMAEKARLDATADKARLEAMIARKEEERRNGAVKHCGDCRIERPVERLLKCNDCNTIVCGNCFFDSHREHSVEKLLGIELDQLQKQNDKRYTEILGGLHGNLKHIQTTIDSAVDEVMEAGKDLLTNIAKCTKYAEAEVIVAKVEKAAYKFEGHCEVYIPVARELTTRLTELGEELKNVEKK